MGLLVGQLVRVVSDGEAVVGHFLFKTGGRICVWLAGDEVVKVSDTGSPCNTLTPSGPTCNTRHEVLLSVLENTPAGHPANLFALSQLKELLQQQVERCAEISKELVLSVSKLDRGFRIATQVLEEMGNQVLHRLEGDES